jgi:hypothetical protein
MHSRMIAGGAIAADQSDMPAKDLGPFGETAPEVHLPAQIADMPLEIVRARA